MLQAKSAQKRQTAIPLKRRNPVDGTLVIILIMLLLAAAMLFLGGVQIKWFALGGAAVAVLLFVYLKTQG